MPDAVARFRPTMGVTYPLLGLTHSGGKHELGIKSYSLKSNFMTATDSWSYELLEPYPDDMRDLVLQPVEITVNGHSQVLGRVDSSEFGGKGSAAKLSGRDFIADLTECHVDPAIKLKENMSLDSAILLACGPVGVTGVVFQNDVGLRNIRTGASLGNPPDPAFRAAKMEEYKSTPGESIFQFCNRIASRHGATIQPGLDRRSVVLAAPDYDQEPAYTLKRSLDAALSSSNNILSATCSRDLSSFPTHVMVTGKKGKGGKTKAPIFAEFDVDTSALQSSKIGNLVVVGRRPLEEPHSLPEGHLYRLRYLRDEDARSEAQIERVSRRLMADRLKDTLRYSAEVLGHWDSNTGATYAVDTMIRVEDEMCGISEDLWIEGREFRYQQGSGATTSLTCWRRDSFVL